MEAHHYVNSPDTGRNSGGRQTVKKNRKEFIVIRYLKSKTFIMIHKCMLIFAYQIKSYDVWKNNNDFKTELNKHYWPNQIFWLNIKFIGSSKKIVPDIVQTNLQRCNWWCSLWSNQDSHFVWSTLKIVGFFQTQIRVLEDCYHPGKYVSLTPLLMH